jgi:uncharacterized protein YbbC (DUF1343 family)
LNLSFLINAYSLAESTTKEKFFNDFFEKLAGTASLRAQIINESSESQIRNSWKKGLLQFKKIRKKYLLYEDFE